MRFTASVQTGKTHLLVYQTPQDTDLSPVEFKSIELSFCSVTTRCQHTLWFFFFFYFQTFQESSSEKCPSIIVAHKYWVSQLKPDVTTPLCRPYLDLESFSSPALHCVSWCPPGVLPSCRSSPFTCGELCLRRHILNSSAHFLACPGGGPSTTGSHVTRATVSRHFVGCIQPVSFSFLFM